MWFPWLLVCFCTTPEPRMVCTFFKGCQRRQREAVTHRLWSAKPKLFTIRSFTEVCGSLLSITRADNDPAAASVPPLRLWFPALSPISLLWGFPLFLVNLALHQHLRGGL